MQCDRELCWYQTSIVVFQCICSIMRTWSSCACVYVMWCRKSVTICPCLPEAPFNAIGLVHFVVWVLFIAYLGHTAHVQVWAPLPQYFRQLHGFLSLWMIFLVNFVILVELYAWFMSTWVECTGFKRLTCGRFLPILLLQHTPQIYSDQSCFIYK